MATVLYICYLKQRTEQRPCSDCVHCGKHSQWREDVSDFDLDVRELAVPVLQVQRSEVHRSMIAVQCSAVQYSAWQCSAVQRSAMQYFINIAVQY